MKQFFLIFFSVYIVTCNTAIQNNKTFVKFPQTLADVGKNECAIKYKNSLYDNNYTLKFKINLVFVYPVSINSAISNYDHYGDSLIQNLNKAYFDEGIEFSIQSTSNIYSNDNIDDLVDAIQNNNVKGKYNDLQDFMNVIVFTESTDVNVAGVSDGIPSTIIGLNLDRVTTSTAPHEMGHALGLRHIFEKDHTDGLNAQYGDLICDTPSFIMSSSDIGRGCKYLGKVLYTEEELNIIIPNYENYNLTYEDCRKNFSPQQSLAMRWHIENYPALYKSLL